jgi:hypothetical protein
MNEAFATDFAGFKTMAGDFFKKAAAGATCEQLNAGAKALGLAFVNMRGTELELHQAEIVLTLAHRKAEEVA